MSQRIAKDFENSTLTISRVFAASAHDLWRAWSSSELLVQWWGAPGWQTSSKSFEFAPGGFWHYCMRGPKGNEAWGRVDYVSIDSPNSFEAVDFFCDSEGNKSLDLPHTRWSVEFSGTHDVSKLLIKLVFASEADMRTIVDMGFEGGMTYSLDTLDQLIYSF